MIVVVFEAASCGQAAPDPSVISALSSSLGFGEAAGRPPFPLLSLTHSVHLPLPCQLRVSLAHQLALTEHHLRLAAELRRPVSMHCVRAYGGRGTRGGGAAFMHCALLR